MTTLLVRHIPPSLSDEALHEFFEHFGAKTVTRAPGKVYSAFVEFNDKETAQTAQKTLNHFKLLDKILLVDFAKEKKSLEKQPFPIARNLGITYPSPPFLQYRYPAQNRTILDNIQNALATVDIFYQQVLHLMNKMNLPPPFNEDFPTANLKELRKRKRYLDISSDESEVHSDEEADEQERKRQKLLKEIKNLKDRTRIEIQHTKKHYFEYDGSVILGQGPVKITVHPDVEIIEKMEKNKESSLFKLEPDKKNDHLLHCATVEQLNSNKLSLEEIHENPRFKNYTPGEPTDKLYIKNLPKDITVEDFYWIFGRHFPDDKVMKRYTTASSLRYRS